MSNDPDWLDELYAQGADEQPPAELDARIRAAARREPRHPWYTNPGRLASLATAASLVIAASVIYFEPAEESLLIPAESETMSAPVLEPVPAPAEVPGEKPMEERSSTAADTDAASMKSISSPRRQAEPKRQAAGRTDGVEAGALEEVIVTAAPASPPTAPDKAESREDSPALSMQKLEFGASLRSTENDSTADLEMSVALELERLCGPLPGPPENRSITSDEDGWLVTVSIGTDVRTWRCQDGAWIEPDSEHSEHQ